MSFDLVHRFVSQLLTFVSCRRRAVFNYGDSERTKFRRLADARQREVDAAKNKKITEFFSVTVLPETGLEDIDESDVESEANLDDLDDGVEDEVDGEVSSF